MNLRLDRTNQLFDVAIIGAGLAGLTAARILNNAGKEVIVLEAQNRVGGRTLTHQSSDGTKFDLGGQWIGPGMHRMYELVREFGLHTFPQYCDGCKLLYLGEKFYADNDLVGAFPLDSQIEWQAMLVQMDQLAATVDLEEPTATPDAAMWDRISIQQWVNSYLHTDAAQRLFQIMICDLFSTEPSEVSMLDLLYNLRSSGAFMNQNCIEGGTLQDRIVEGTQTIAKCLAAQLYHPVRLNSPVRRIEQFSESLELTTDTGTYLAKRIIIAIPLTQVPRIEFKPALPRQLTRTIQKLRMGAVIKSFAIYDTPFWREAGYNGELFTDKLLAYDGTSCDGLHPALVVLTPGDKAVEWSDLTSAQRKDMILYELASAFGEKAMHPKEYIEHDWVAEPWIEGGYNTFTTPGALTAGFTVPDLSQPIHRIHWAGSDLATEFPGYMEGAIASGEQAAKEVLNAFGIESFHQLLDFVLPPLFSPNNQVSVRLK